MTLAISNLNSTGFLITSVIQGAAPFARDYVRGVADRIHRVVRDPIGQWVIGCGLGLASNEITFALTKKVVTALGCTIVAGTPLGLGWKLLSFPLVCILGPIWEENQFRGSLQQSLNEKLETFYQNRGFSPQSANLAARTTSIFFTSVVFGLFHFTNALFFWCNPMIFLPQVIAATFIGLFLGLAKEMTGELNMPIGMHMGYNFIGWKSF